VGQTELTSDLPYHFALQHLHDRDGTPVAVAVVKATFTIAEGSPRLADEQLPVFPAGVPLGEPGKSSYLYEPECSYYKPNTDVVFIGDAIPPSGAATQVEVCFSLGGLRKRAMAIGDRFWMRSLGGTYLSSPEPFERMPLTYERAFGGWDRSDPNPAHHNVEARNPVGAGFSRKFAPGQEQIALANIEDARDRVKTMDSRPKPVGFGFTNPDWQPRASLAGTYDTPWAQNRKPLLPTDFDPSFFNGASEGLRANGYLVGNEQVALENCSSRPFATFSLPGILPPRCRFRLVRRTDHTLTTNLDTVVVNARDSVLVLTWRCFIPLPRGPEFLLGLHLSEGQ
jgi:hypothetical protein